ncbi:MAG: hypothetical protein AB7I79_01975 [Rhizobiaceae bacterium]
MLTQQTMPLNATWRPLEIASAIASGVSKTIRSKLAALRSDRLRSKLPPHLRYDIGELDCRPERPQTLDQVLSGRQTSLEGVWLRYGL